MKNCKVLTIAILFLISCRNEDKPKPIAQIPFFNNWKYTGIEVNYQNFISSCSTNDNLFILFSDKFLCLDKNNEIIQEVTFEKKCWTSPLPYLNSDFYITMHFNSLHYPNNEVDIDVNSTVGNFEKSILNYLELQIKDPNVPWDQYPVELSPAWHENLCAINDAKQILFVFRDYNSDNFIFYLFNTKVIAQKILLELKKQFVISEFKDISEQDLTIYGFNNLFIFNSAQNATYALNGIGEISKISNWCYPNKPIIIKNKVYINFGLRSKLLYSDDYGITWQEKELELPHQIFGQIGDTLFGTKYYFEAFPIAGPTKEEIVKTTDLVDKDTIMIGSTDTTKITYILKIFNDKLYGICNDKLYSLDLK